MTRAEEFPKCGVRWEYEKNTAMYKETSTVDEMSASLT